MPIEKFRRTIHLFCYNSAILEYCQPYTLRYIGEVDQLRFAYRYATPKKEKWRRFVGEYSDYLWERKLMLAWHDSVFVLLGELLLRSGPSVSFVVAPKGWGEFFLCSVVRSKRVWQHLGLGSLLDGMQSRLTDHPISCPVFVWVLCVGGLFIGLFVSRLADQI